jgi:cell division protein FtsQ
VRRFPVVKDLQISTQFPHGMKIRVIEQIPVAVIAAAGRRIAVAGDGTLLRDVRPSPSLPEISLRAVPGGSRLENHQALTAVSVLGAAPYQLLGHVGGVTRNPAHGVVVELRHGPSLYFGDPILLSSKWTAVAGVLADPGSAGASYIDVVDPERPAAGTAASAPAPGASTAAASQGSGAPSSTSEGG